MRALTFSFLAFWALAGAAAAGDVKMYDQAPSVEELQRQLGSGEPQKKKVRTRAIVFGGGDAQQPEPAPAAQEAAPRQPAQFVDTAQEPQKPAARPARPTQATAPVSAPAAAPAAAGAAMQVSENAIAFPINFKVNSSEIQPESIPFINSIAGLLKKDPSIRLLVEGHTDASGNAARNLTLSRERAYSITNYLIDRLGVDPGRLVPMGKGSSEPMVEQDPYNPRNRRVQFRVIG